MPSDSDDPFAVELKRWRDVRGVSQKALGAKVSYDPSYVSKVEGSKQNPSIEFAREADSVLRAGGALRRAFSARKLWLEKHQDVRQQDDADLRRDEEQQLSLVVEHDNAELVYDGRSYRAIMRRRLRNASDHPVTRYLIRISVDRFPGNPERSNQLYREDPLTWQELDLEARCGDEAMTWKVQHDRDAFKEVWLLFENDDGRFPLYPGDSTTVEYAYTVSNTKWGHWFQRAVRLPTECVSVTLRFPSELQPVVWGMETTMTAEAFPFRTAIDRTTEEGTDVFSWSTDAPPLGARFRLEWRFKAQDDDHSEHTPSETMTAMGIVQEGAEILSRPGRRYNLPEEADDARRAVAELASAIDRVAEVHNFGKGMGLAAPQIGIDRAVAIVRPPGSSLPITLLNPQIIEESADIDEQYEGCLSFFDVRGKVPRPLTILVEYQDIDGATRIASFERGVARLVAHEIDHLQGVLYRARMNDDTDPIHVIEYKGGGKQWSY